MNNSITVYGIKNCDTVKKALKFLAGHSISYQFIDYRERPISEKQYEEKGHSLDKASDIIMELITTLDKDKGGEIAFSLANLYNFVLREINDANTKLNTKSLDSAIKILSELRESWESIKDSKEIDAMSQDHSITQLDISG